MRYRRITNKYSYLISDTLPFETPVIFSNRLLTNYFKKIKLNVEIHDDEEQVTIKWESNNGANTKAILRLLFGIPEVEKKGKDSKDERKELNYKLESIPFSYRIQQGLGKTRTLAIPHPLNQIAMMAYFEKYSELILYYASKSKYSLRHPQKKASWRYIKDYSHYLSASSSDSKATIEEFSSEYESQRSYFRYEKYSNIYKFYESSYYHSLEKKYRHLYKLDISKCFDSIYTHSCSWAVLGKEYSKMNRGKNSFIACFDLLMRSMNRNETNGILIGPEFSRIFSEIILQAIDTTIESNLKEKKYTT